MNANLNAQEKFFKALSVKVGCKGKKTNRISGQKTSKNVDDGFE